MKLISFSDSGKQSFGKLDGDGIVDLGRHGHYASLRAALEADALDELAASANGAPPDYKLADVTLLTPVPDAEKLICIGVNYKGHIVEMPASTARGYSTPA